MKKNGFTLLETLVAVTILVLSIVAPMYAANRALVAAEISRDQLVASAWAQEGVEQIRAVRDHLYLADYPNNTAAAWNDFINASADCVAPSDSCKVDFANQTIQKGSLKSNDANVGITNGGTIYTRKITIEPIPNVAYELRVVSTVSWNFHNSAETISISDHLTAWQ